MKKKRAILTGVFSVLLVLQCPAVPAADAPLRARPDDWAQPVLGSELDNFYKISDHLYRSEQPDDDAFAQVKKLGIKEVLNLRSLHTDNDEAEKTGLKLHHLRMNAGDVSEEEVFQALKIIRDAKGPILIHCWHGSDRTGAVAAAYRMVFQKWSAEKAIDEMRHGGYGYHETTYPNLIQLIRRLDVEDMQKKLDVKEKEHGK